MSMFLRAYAISEWDYKLPYVPKSHKRILPFPDVVNKFFNYKFSNDIYENKLFQYMFFHSFMIGWRAPSEIVAMTIEDVIIDTKGRGSLTITETKKIERKERSFQKKQFLHQK